MPHPSHKLKSYRGDFNKPVVFCENCGQEDDEAGIHEECPKTFHKLEEQFFNEDVMKGVDRRLSAFYRSNIAR